MTRSPIDGAAAVVFDFDGTLAELNIDFPALYVKIFELADGFGVDRTKVSERYLIELIDQMTAQLSDGQAAQFLAAATRLVVDEEVASARRASLFDGTRELLIALRDKGHQGGDRNPQLRGRRVDRLSRRRGPRRLLPPARAGRPRQAPPGAFGPDAGLPAHGAGGIGAGGRPPHRHRVGQGGRDDPRRGDHGKDHAKTSWSRPGP